MPVFRAQAAKTLERGDGKLATPLVRAAGTDVPSNEASSGIRDAFFAAIGEFKPEPLD